MLTVTNLRKTFQTKRKTAGLSGSLRALIRPEYFNIEAVRGLSFQMEKGELLGFIGPNGAGKSTTIKILTGILHPSGGEAACAVTKVGARFRRKCSGRLKSPQQLQSRPSSAGC